MKRKIDIFCAVKILSHYTFVYIFYREFYYFSSKILAPSGGYGGSVYAPSNAVKVRKQDQVFFCVHLSTFTIKLFKST